MTEEHQTEEHQDYLEEERVPEHSGTNHSMAIGFYIAALILIYGVTMVLVGIISPAAPSEGDLGFNVNLWWGLVMVVSGCVILGMTLASPRRRAAQRQRSNSNRVRSSGPASSRVGQDAGPGHPSFSHGFASGSQGASVA